MLGEHGHIRLGLQAQQERRLALSQFFFFFNDTATTEIYTLSLHDALPISLVIQTTLLPHLELFGVVPDLLLVVIICVGLVRGPSSGALVGFAGGILRDLLLDAPTGLSAQMIDRKSTRLNSSHVRISYAVVC